MTSSTNKTMLLPLIFTLLCVFVPSLLLIVYIWRNRKKSSRKTYLLFIDAPDPDNPACAVALWNHFLHRYPSPHLHVVLTGRPVDLRTKKQFKDDFPIKDQVVRQPWESTDRVHSQRLVKDSAARLANYFTSMGLRKHSFTIYDGGIAPNAPISDVVHDWEFLYDRKDLVTNNSSDEGEIISGEIISGEGYRKMVHEYNLLSEDKRESAFLSLLREYDLTPLSQLRVLLKQKDHKDISVFLGGPATAVVDLFQGDQNSLLRAKVTELYAMFGALSPEKSTLLGNQFNAACDIESAAQLFMDRMFPDVPMYLIPTETAKLPQLIVSANELETRGAHPYVINLMRLWESTHNGQAQPIFDVIPVMAALPQFKDAFVWKKHKVVIQDWSKEGKVRQRFIFTETDRGSLYVSDGTFNVSRESFLQFLDVCFYQTAAH